jgi:hypothetical protein
MWTGPVILTLVIAGFALALSVISLGWQVHSWRHSGPRVTVKRTRGIGGTARGVWFTGVQAVNSGRLGTQIQQFGFQLPNGQIITALYEFIGQPIQLPMDLPAGGTASVMYNARNIREALAGQPRFGEEVRPFVVTGHGRFEGEKIDLVAEVDLLCRHELQ